MGPPLGWLVKEAPGFHLGHFKPMSMEPFETILNQYENISIDIG